MKETIFWRSTMPKKTFFQLPEDKRQRIINATYDEFIENEYEKVSIRGIAKRAGISVGSFYQYFYDKDELYIHLISAIERKIYLVQKGETEDSMFTENVIDIEEICTEKEVKFDRTWYNVPTDIMRKFYFGEYFDMMGEDYRLELEELREKGKLKENIDIDLVVYMYVTSMFNILMYFNKYNIVDNAEKMKIKKKFFRDVIPNGIMKK